jgi:hypothetical protein
VTGSLEGPIARLAHAESQCPRSSPNGRSSRDIYVRSADLERAREVLKADEGGFDEDELARLSEEAGKERPAEP